MMFLTAEEDVLFNNYVMIGWAQQTLERDLRLLPKTVLRFPEIYEPYIAAMLDKIAIDMRDVKSEMKKRKMVVLDPVKDKQGGLNYTIHVRGYELERGFDMNALREGTREKIANYTK